MYTASLRQVKQLVDALESADAFDRRSAIERLAVLTQQRLDYRWSAEDTERQRAVKRWRRWVAREERQRRGKATIQIFADGKIDQAALDKALLDLAPADKKALMQSVLAKVVAQHASIPAMPVCQMCERRPAATRVTELTEGGEYVQRRLCEICASKRGC